MASGYFFDNLKRFFTLNKKLVWVIFLLALVGILTGVFCSLKVTSLYTLTMLRDMALKQFFLKKVGGVGYILLKILSVVALLFVIYFLSFFKFGRFLFWLVMGLLAYFIGIDCVILIKVFGGIRGTVFAFVCVVPFSVSVMFLLFVFGLKLGDFNRQMCAFGNSCSKNQEFKLLLFFVLLISLVIILQGIFLAIFSKIFVF